MTPNDVARMIRQYDESLSENLKPLIDTIQNEFIRVHQQNKEQQKEIDDLKERIKNLEEILHDPSNIVKHRLRDEK